ncbi:MAG: O-acetyl-ADP-ribose deacetylase [Phycisphaerales bacterium]|nr:MAG: O-acetyl-ADP-ribose deacetylase [Phycisphaerales bacterium]
MSATNLPWGRIELVEGDITKQEVDAIVNAANTSLLGGGGVDGAIHRAAGPGLLAECRPLGGCDVGSAKITGGHNLPAKHVIHTVGPVYHGGDKGEPDLLAGCYRTAMQLADENGCRSIAFSAISCGVYGYPMADAARLAMTVVAEELAKRPKIEVARFVLFGRDALQVFTDVYRDLAASRS